MVNAVVARDTPGHYQEQSKRSNNRVDTDGTCEQEVHVHERPEEGGNTSQYTEDQAQSNKHLTESHYIGEHRGIR